MAPHKQFLAFYQHVAVATPHAETHRAVQKILDPNLLIVAIQIVVGPPEQATQINLFLRLVVALSQEGPIVLDKSEFPLVVGETNTIKTP